MIKTLQSLRFLFVMLIFMSHFDYGGISHLVGGGDCGVVFFLLLSGFLLARRYWPDIEKGNFSYRQFLWKRLIGIYPLHILCLLAFLLLWPQVLDLRVLANLLLVHSWIPDATFYFSFNSVSWFLSVIFFCYLAFPLLYRIPTKYLLPIVSVAYLAIVLTVPNEAVNNFLYVNPLLRTFDFYLGICVWRISLQIRKLPVPTLLEFLCICVVVLSIVCDPHVSPKFSNAPLYWLSVMPTLLVFSKEYGGISRVLRTRFIVSLGNLTLPFFMTHKMVITFVMGLFRHYNITPSYLPALSACLFLTLLVSWVLQRYFLRPVGSLLGRNR